MVVENKVWVSRNKRASREVNKNKMMVKERLVKIRQQPPTDRQEYERQTPVSGCVLADE